MTLDDLAYLGAGAAGILVFATTLVRATSAFNALRGDIAAVRSTLQLDMATVRGASDVQAQVSRSVTDRLERVENDVSALHNWKNDHVTIGLLRIDELWLVHERMPPRSK